MIRRANSLIGLNANDDADIEDYLGGRLIQKRKTQRKKKIKRKKQKTHKKTHKRNQNKK
jgi:hypothetical protein